MISVVETKGYKRFMQKERIRRGERVATDAQEDAEDELNMMWKAYCKKVLQDLMGDGSSSDENDFYDDDEEDDWSSFMSCDSDDFYCKDHRHERKNHQKNCCHDEYHQKKHRQAKKNERKVIILIDFMYYI